VKHFAPDVGQSSTIQSRTVSTLVVLEDSDLPSVKWSDIQAKQRENGRKKLGSVLKQRLQDDDVQLKQVMALHCVGFLLDSHNSFYPLLRELWHQFEEDEAIHRMRQGRKTTSHPLATTNLNEASVQGNWDVLQNAVLNGLDIPEERLHDGYILVGGDLATIEGVRLLQQLSGSCMHGFGLYNWILPVVQLWHMQWADLACCVNTHWGTNNREGTSLEVINVQLRRSVKPVLQPNFYSSQKLLFDTLRAEVLDCFWCVRFL
jgi:hypothetical protein